MSYHRKYERGVAIIGISLAEHSEMLEGRFTDPPVHVRYEKH